MHYLYIIIGISLLLLSRLPFRIAEQEYDEKDDFGMYSKTRKIGFGLVFIGILLIVRFFILELK